MARTGQRRLLEERAMEQGIAAAKGDGIRARSVTVNIAESPLGWLFSRGLVSRRQFMRESACGPIGSVRSLRRA
jgi:hypothetical protein